MSWSNHYTLPWDRLDLQKIEAAMRHVVASLSPRETRVVVHDPDHVSCFFEVSPDEEREWDVLGDVEERFALYQVAESDRGWVEVVFLHLPPDDEHGFEGWTLFEFDSGHSGNGLFSGCAIRITGLFGKYFGVDCDPW